MDKKKNDVEESQSKVWKIISKILTILVLGVIFGYLYYMK